MIPKRKQQPREIDIQRAVIANLNLIPGVHVWRQNTGAARDQLGRVVRFGIPGQADITGLLPCGRRLEVEVKSATGPQTPEQAAFQRMVEEHGGLYVLARSVEQAINLVRAATW